jgi:hypothetical protein
VCCGRDGQREKERQVVKRRTGHDLVIIIPLWRRVSHITRVYQSALESTPDARILFVASVGDDVVMDAVSTGDVPFTTIAGNGGGLGDYASKINAGYRATSEPWLFTGADDLHFHPGWYEAARIVASEEGIGVIGTADLSDARTMNGTHSTHSLVARWYADAGGSVDADHQIYHEGYAHWFCDDELVQTALARGAYGHALDAVVEHLHAIVDKSPDDATYLRGRATAPLGLRRYRKRRLLWTLP